MRIIQKTGDGKNKVLDIVSKVLLLIAVVFTSYVMIMNFQGKAASVFGYSILKVATGSMEPTIDTGEYIIVKKTDVKDINVGDIITYYSEDPEIKDFMVTHRVIRLNEDGTFVTMGDANPVEDYIDVKPERILGRFVRKSHFFGVIGGFANVRKIVLAGVTIVILVMATYELRSLTKLWKKYNFEENGEVKKDIDTNDREVEIEKIKAKAIEEYLKQRNEGNNE